MKPFYADDTVVLHHGDSLEVLRTLDAGSVDCCVTSPPYFGLRDYGIKGQYGLEVSPAAYVETMRRLFAEVRRVLADDGTFWLNVGDSYSRGEGTFTDGPQQSRNGKGVVGPRDLHPSANRAAGTRSFAAVPQAKNLLGIPWRVAFALQDDGWILRNDIIWAKPNAMPESVTDRLSTRHEHLFMFSKKPRYWFDLDPIREPLTTGDNGSEWHTGKTGEHQLGRASTKPRPQTVRAIELAKEKGLTAAHLAAVRSVGMSDAGKAQITQDGSGKNSAETQRLADEAKLALGGYFREFANDGKGRNPGDVWTIPTQPFSAAHFAVMPQQLAARAIQAGCKPGGTVLDPFSGSGTTGLAAAKHGRRYVGIDLNADYLNLSLRTRLAQTSLLDEEPA